LGAFAEETLMCVLAVQIDQTSARFRKATNRCEVSVDVRARPAVGRNHTTENHLVVGFRIDESTLDARLVATVSHHSTIAATTNEKVDRFDDHRLAGTRFTRECGETSAELNGDRVDDSEIANIQLGEH
jgi:hypothetical protein